MKSNEVKAMVGKLQKAASVKMSKGEDFLYEGPEGSIKWSDLVNVLNEVELPKVYAKVVEKPIQNDKVDNNE